MRKDKIFRAKGESLPTIQLKHAQYKCVRSLSPIRERYLAIDRSRRSVEPNCVVYVSSKNSVNRKRVELLQGISESLYHYPKLIDWGVVQEQFVIVMQWLEGDSLRSIIDEHQAKKHGIKCIHPATALRWFYGFAHGIAQLDSRRGIVHGDIKPENLIVTKSEDKLVPIDYGSAWTRFSGKLREAGDGYSRHYASPEQRANDDLVDFRSDYFSSCVVFYEMLTPGIPYTGVDDGRGGTYIPPSRVTQCPDGLPKRVWDLVDDFILTGLSENRDNRHRTSKEWRSSISDIKRVYDNWAQADPLADVRRGAEEDDHESDIAGASSFNLSMMKRARLRLANLFHWAGDRIE